MPSQTLGTASSVHRDSPLKDAEVMVSAGRGIGKKENISLIKRLAALFPKVSHRGVALGVRPGMV